MKQVMAPVFVAFDGTKFFEAAPCEKHEEDNFPMRFVGLTIEQVDAAFDRRDKELAKAFETAGNRIGSKRRVEDNEYLRGPKRQDNGTPEPPQQISANPDDRREPEDTDESGDHATEAA